MPVIARFFVLAGMILGLAAVAAVLMTVAMAVQKAGASLLRKKRPTVREDAVHAGHTISRVDAPE